MYKVAIIGAGIVGSSIARVLSKYENLEVFLIEKEVDVGWGATKANTGIIHPGHEDEPKKYPKRAELCIKGNRLWRDWTKELDIPVRWPGELMVAKNQAGLKTLKRYQKIGEKNDVQGLKIVDKEELNGLDSNLNESAEYALWAPTAGVLAPWEAVIGLVENAVDNGVKTLLNTNVEDIIVENGRVHSLITDNGELETDVVINAAGLFADKISEMVSENDFEIRPRKGQYILFDEDVEEKPDKIIHPTPSEKTKGVYAVKTVEGNLMLGPTAADLDRESKDERSTNEEGLDFIWKHAEELLEELPSKEKISKTFAGLRPEPPEGRYKIEAIEDIFGFINVAGIRSPGLTAAPAIAQKVEDILRDQVDIELIEKKDWKPTRKGINRLPEKNSRKKKKMIQRNSDYGRVVCMCKEVTKAEILEAVDRIKKIDGEVTLDSVKFRTLALFGFCQGSYCRTRIARILSEELDVPMWDIEVREEGTKYGIGDVKTLRRSRREEG